MSGVRWRIEYAGLPPETYESRRAAVCALRAARSRGQVATLVRVETVVRRWRVGMVRCRVMRASGSTVWWWQAATSDGWVDTLDAAIEAAEKAARGTR